MWRDKYTTMVTALVLGLLLQLISITFAKPEIPTQANAFNGYNYPKPSIPFNPGYAYPAPSCPLALPSTSYVTVPVTETSIMITTLPPVTITLPRLTEYFTETQLQISTTTSVDYRTSTTTEFQIQPTTVTAYVTSTYYAPTTPQNTYLPATRTPPPPPSNTYLPANQPQPYLNAENTTPNSFLQSFSFSQAGPIKRMTNDINSSSLESDDADLLLQRNSDLALMSSEQLESVTNKPSQSQQQLPAINIIYLDRTETNSDGRNGTGSVPAADLMNWLLCRFNLANRTCLN
ncbi:uncharacterized protein LOC134215074 [Armigeres subalbatus]|uniref:uncharacterized protein LOC134215074 n=1 Tax=Armigeres subalbatus TaxID=124917 RepID=UPI002ED07E32